MEKNNKSVVYSVVVNKNKLNCINASNGSLLTSLNIDGVVKSGPIVLSDRCVVVFDKNSKLKGKIYKLPSFSLITTFNP